MALGRGRVVAASGASGSLIVRSSEDVALLCRLLEQAARWPGGEPPGKLLEHASETLDVQHAREPNQPDEPEMTTNVD